MTQRFLFILVLCYLSFVNEYYAFSWLHREKASTTTKPTTTTKSTTTTKPQTQSELLQCPCILKPGTTECLQYDSRYQAATLNEALSSFLDLSLSDEPSTFIATATETTSTSAPATRTHMLPHSAVSLSMDTMETGKQGYGGGAPIPTFSDGGAPIPESQACEDLLKQRLQKIGLMPPPLIPTNSTNTPTMTCNKYRFARGDQSVYSYGHQNCQQQNKNDNNDGSGSEYSENSGYDPNSWPDGHGEGEGGPNLDVHINLQKGNSQNQQTYNPNNPEYRYRRQAATQTIIGTRYNLSCTAKGIDDGTGYLSLCSKCWAWRQLPVNYFPQYINELVCDNMDSDCLSGFATCALGTRVIEVLRNDSGVLNVVTLSAGSYCECKVLAGSQLESLVTGQGTTQIPSTTQKVKVQSSSPKPITNVQTQLPITKNLPIIGR